MIPPGCTLEKNLEKSKQNLDDRLVNKASTDQSRTLAKIPFRMYVIKVKRISSQPELPSRYAYTGVFSHAVASQYQQCQTQFSRTTSTPLFPLQHRISNHLLYLPCVIKPYTLSSKRRSSVRCASHMASYWVLASRLDLANIRIGEPVCLPDNARSTW